MHNQSQIRRMLAEAGLTPRRRLGQCFLVDGNLLASLLDLADLRGGETVLEVGAGTGSLTEELLVRAGRVVAVEIDRGLGELLARRLGHSQALTLIRGDCLAGKHALAPPVLAALGPRAHLVANLPYSIASPLVAECLWGSWRAGRGEPACRFDRLTFTVQREVADRLAASPGGSAYGPLSVIVAVLGRLQAGANVPATAFWPRPKVSGRILRIDFDAAAAGRLDDAGTLSALLAAAFGQRRKQIGSLRRRHDVPWTPEALAAAFDRAGIDPGQRPQTVTPGQFLALANALSAETNPP